MAEASEYEVRCPRCNVSFPVGTRTCLHCGGATAAGAPGARLWRDQSAAQPFDQRMREPGTQRDDGVLPPLPLEGEVGDVGEEEPSARGRMLRAAVTVLWILLAIGFSAVRACSEK